MKIAMSYFVKLENGTRAWLAVGKGIPDGATVVEERPMIVPDFGLALRHKTTGEISYGHWLRGEDSADKWEEIDEPKEEQGAE